MSSSLAAPRPARWLRRATLVAAPILAVGIGAAWAPTTAAPASAQHSATGRFCLAQAAEGAGSARAVATRRTSIAEPSGWSAGRQTAELTSGDQGACANFGSSVAISSDRSTAVIGAFNHDGHTGAAYVFVRDGKQWSQVQQLTVSDGAQYDYLGYSVAVSSDGSTVLVGAYGHDASAGTVYVFTHTGTKWRQTAELTPDDAAAGNAFGYTVQVSGDGSSAVIGSPNNAGDTGAVYLFALHGGGWTQTAELTASDAAPNTQFGYTVAASADGSTVVVGSPDNNDLVGATYVFTRHAKRWVQAAELTATDGASLDEFGYSVAVSADGSTAVIGGYGHDSYTGAAYVFTDSAGSWQQTAELAASDGAQYDDFGYSVAMTADGATIMVGASGHANLTGAAYVFHHGTTWRQTGELTASDGAQLDEFGYAVALSPTGSTALIGAYGRDADIGAAYVFTR